MKKLISCIFIVLFLGLLYEGAAKLHFNSLQEGFSLASKAYTTCPSQHEFNHMFPEYFNACEKLCNTLYNEKNLCVSSINGGSVTCVCEQTKIE